MTREVAFTAEARFSVWVIRGSARALPIPRGALAGAAWANVLVVATVPSICQLCTDAPWAETLSALRPEARDGAFLSQCGASQSVGILETTVTLSRTSRKVSPSTGPPLWQGQSWQVERQCLFQAPALRDVVFEDAGLSHHCEDVHEVTEGRTWRDEPVHHALWWHKTATRVHPNGVRNSTT